MRNINKSPDFEYGRLVLANDAAPTAQNENWGWNFRAYQRALFNIIPIQNPPANGDQFFEGKASFNGNIGAPTSTVVAQVWFFDVQAGIWMRHIPDLTFTAGGAGQAMAIDLDVFGRRVGLMITGVSATQGVVILASGMMRFEIE